ncbi:MAG: hypothetical protein ACI89X_004365, partial [Planctomycetota bacterium]
MTAHLRPGHARSARRQGRTADYISPTVSEMPF